MSSPDPRWQSFAALLTRLRDGWPPPRWGWDDRFDCALSTLSKAEEAAALQVLGRELPVIETAATIADAPLPLQQLGRNTGGMRGAQKLFSTEAQADGASIYCLWWPWGNGSSFSARLGASGLGDARELRTLLRTGLGIA